MTTGDRRRILIVEDEKVNQMMLGNMLQDEFEVLYADDGIEAMEKIRACREELSIVLLDLLMPRMDGMEVLRTMQGEAELADIPVIVLTADQSAEVECLGMGAMDFIPKPYPESQIVRARVNRCIELSEKRTIIESTERDPLTGLYNLSYFRNYVMAFDRRNKDVPMDAIILSIKHFHMINERYGRQYGNSVLSRIGDRVRKVTREIGGVACYKTDDTFLLYCPHRDDYEEILRKLSDDLSGDESAVDRVRLRMGVYPDADKRFDIERRFEYARIAANNIRDGYKSEVGIYDNEMHKKDLHREKLLEDFRPSLESGRFKVYYQPKYDVRGDEPKLASTEALVRWDHPEFGLISPAEFIPLLEDNGLILELDLFVWKSAASLVKGWKDRFGFSIPVSVNVSRIDMLTPDLGRAFRDILSSHGLGEKDLMLEITESAYAEDAEQILATARVLRGMGFIIEMDDFGTGYSSLGMLSDLPIDVLKLDMSFVRRAFGENHDVRMIELILDIADYLNVPVVAEGVETEEQYLGLKEMGCAFVQGYYFSKPLPAEEFDNIIKEHCEDGRKLNG